MDGMNDYFNQLEEHLELEVSIIRATKINKVLKAILKLEEIPKDADYKFKDRSNTLLNNWNKLLSSGGAGDGEAVETPTTTDAPKPTLNGASLEGDSTKTENDTVMSELAEAPKETSANIGNNAGDEADADVSMTDAKSIEAEAPAAPAAEEVKPAPAAGETTATA